MTREHHRTRLSRRNFLTTSAFLLAGAAVSPPLGSLMAKPVRHQLSFYHTHTGENLSIEVSPGRHSRRTRETINRFLRDFRTGEIHPIDTALIDLLCHIQDAGKSTGTFEVISGYRSPATNSMLRQRGNGVAKRSLHMQGRAIDVRLTDVKTKTLRTIACDLKRGGVGYYGASDFVHLDTGRPRAW